MLGGVSLDMAYGPDNQGFNENYLAVDNRPPPAQTNTHQENPHVQKEKSTYINNIQKTEQDQDQIQQMYLQQKLKNLKKNKKKQDDDYEDEPSFFEKLKMKKSEIGKFLTLCGILVIALGYDKFLKLTINKISDSYDFTESQKYYLIFGIPSVLLLLIIYFIAA
jgi:hypothetical protein